MYSFNLILAALLISIMTVGDSDARTLRSVGDEPGKTQPLPQIFDIDERFDTLAYEDPDRLPWFWSIPDVDSIGDLYPNVRFSSEYAPFYLMEAHIPLFDMFGNQGTPDMWVIVYQSGEIDDIPGYPVQPIDSVLIPFEDLVFGGQEVIWNVIDLRDLEISFIDLIDFHISVSPVRDEDTDTLAVYFDDGEYSETTRSGIWDGELQGWNKLDEVNGMELPFNFAIHAVISDEPTGVPGDLLLPASRHPSTVRLMSTYPNPFNNRLHVNFDAPFGAYYTVNLLDQTGRKLRTVHSGLSAGAGNFTLNADGLPTGAYYLMLESGQSTAANRIFLIR